MAYYTNSDSKPYKTALDFYKGQVQVVKDLLHDSLGDSIINADSANSREQNICFYFINEDNELRSVAVKADRRTHKTGNIMVETQQKRLYHNQMYINERGWFYTCGADYLFIVNAAGHLIYLFEWLQLKDFIKSESDTIHEEKWINRFDESTTSFGYPISLKVLSENQLVLNAWRIPEQYYQPLKNNSN